MQPQTDQEPERRWILVVDADAQTQRLLDLSLRNAGFEVKTAGSSVEALTWLGENRPDLIIADTELAGTVDGFDLCRRVKQRPETASIPFVFLAESSVENRMRGVEAGADDFLTKPLYVQEMLVRARGLLQRRERDRLLALAETNERFVGEIEDIPLVDLLRAIESNQKSGVIHLVDQAGARGEVYFRQGAVVDAEIGRLSGREAVYRLFSWSRGRFEIEWKSIRRKDTIELDPSTMLVEALRRVDEWRRLLADVPPLDTIFEVDYRLLAERLAEIPDEVNSILRLFDGVRTFIQVIDDCGLGDLEAVAVIGKLHRESIIRDVKVKPESDDLPSTDIEGWLSDASGPFRSAPEPARRDLFGSGPHGAGASGVHKRPTTPVDPLEEGGREALADDMRARFTDRLHAEGRSSEAAAAIEPPPPPPAPTPKPMPVSEITLQGVGVPSQYQHRPSTSPGFAASATTGKHPLPEVTPPMRAPASAAAAPGRSDGIPEPVAPADGEAAIVIPFPAPEARKDEPSGPSAMIDDTRAVAGEIVARPSGTRPRESRASEERLAQLREVEAGDADEPLRSTERGLGPELEPPEAAAPELGDPQPEELRPLAADGGQEVQEAAPWRAPAPEADAPPVRAERQSEQFSAAEAADELGVGSGKRGLALTLAGVAVLGGVAWGLVRFSAAREKAAESAEHAAASAMGGSSGAARGAAKGEGAGTAGGEAQGDHAKSGAAGTAGARAPQAAASGAGATSPGGAAAPSGSPAAPAAAGGPGSASDPGSSAAAASPSAALGAGGDKTAGAGAKAGAAASTAVRLPPGRGAAPPPPAAEELDERAADPKLSRQQPVEFPQLLAACRAAFVEKRMKDAEGACTAAKDAGPESAEAHALLAHALFNRNRRREAMSWAEKAIKIDPRLADAYVIIGGVHQEAGQKDDARAAYKKYLELAPSGQYASDLRAIVNGMEGSK